MGSTLVEALVIIFSSLFMLVGLIVIVNLVPEKWLRQPIKSDYAYIAHVKSGCTDTYVEGTVTAEPVDDAACQEGAMEAVRKYYSKRCKNGATHIEIIPRKKG